MEGIVNFGLIAAYVLVIVGGLGAILLPLINSLSNPKSLIYTGIAIVVLAVLFGISYGIAGNEVTAHYTRYGVDASSSKIVGGALTMMYLLILVALVGIVYTEISKIIK